MIAVGGALSASPCLAVDIGASKFDAAIVSRDGTFLRRHRVKVSEFSDDLFAALVTLLRHVLADDVVDMVGVGCAGPMTRGGETVSPLNIAAWREFPLRQSLRDALGIDVYIDGDARALALAEGVFG